MIVALRSGEDTPLPWGSVTDCEIVTSQPNQLAALLSEARSDRIGRVIIDCTAVDFALSDFPLSDLGSANRLYSLIFVCRPGNPDLIEESIGSHNQVWWYIPYLFEPGVIESKRTLLQKRLGEFRGGELTIRVGNRNRQAEISGSMLPLYFRGTPKGVRRSNRPPGVIYSYDDIAIFVGSAASSGSTTSISGTFACSGGSIVFNSGDNRITLHPAGASPRFLPLPEGDGTYYFMRELLRSIPGDGGSPISTEIVRKAFSITDRAEG